ncbi:spike glycoprotein [BtNv-AlphaCoV/SC2013]|uniref:Spike glycoprotein n=1 Tax=BtNv-AlphaCoV/SC2013 TaxID=1503291 RepID=A0A0U1UZD0_9ALPC|nr:spike glycoprotein [BtNv-AlphaCoV/SC2013]AIA62265.1 spike glycoprotein [BtNv-AlphaCoV/SC2013]
MKINLGLPPSTSSFVSGYLPTPGNWTCRNGGTTKLQGHARAVFMRYYAYARAWSFGVGPSTTIDGHYGLYVWHSNSAGHMTVRICRWYQDRDPIAQNSPHDTTSSDCILNVRQPYVFTHAGFQVIGVSWTGEAVTVYGKSKLYRLYVPGASLWNSVAFTCSKDDSCGHQIITKPITVNATTDDKGVITSYTVCDRCDGFPHHVFAVQEGGKIPGSFDFTNWFYLTNTSSPFDGRFVSNQPLQIQCLWPIPALTSTTGIIYFNSSRFTDPHQRCNGYNEVGGLADHLRFAINVTDRGAFQLGVISLLAVHNAYNFSCSNISNFVDATTIGVPFGKTYQPYYCFVTEGYNISANRTFVGVMPSDVREIVVSRYGSVYINGYKIFNVGELYGVVLNFSSLTGSDFWTVAYANEVNVLVDIEETYITGILYCDTPLNRLKCQQQRFFMDDGFYSAIDLAPPVVQTIVLLPEYTGLTNITLDVNVTFNPPSCIQCAPTVNSILLNGESGGSVCVSTNRFSVDFKLTVNSQAYDIGVRTGSCPFSYGSLNNFVKFGSICFSLVDNGGCPMPINAINYIKIEYPIGVLYVTHSPGEAITGVPKGFIKRLGFLDASILHLNVCTEYNIYGIVGKGIINKANSTLHTGIVYTDTAGVLVSFKNVTTGDIYSVIPCQTSMQYAVIADNIVGVISADTATGITFNHTIATPMFYYSTNTDRNCTEPVLTYATMGICADGAIGYVQPRVVSTTPATPITTGNLTIPVNFTVSIQAEYVQVSLRAVVVDCATYVCNGNVRCLQLLRQYVTACTSVENALALNARLESQEVADMLAVDYAAYRSSLELNTPQFENGFNISAVLPAGEGKGSFIEDLLFDKVITNGLGTVDADYKRCIEEKGAIADVVCRQYYKGISVLPALTDPARMGLYSASLMGALTLGAFGGGAVAAPFSIAVFSKLNYIALQTDLIQENQKLISAAFNNAMGNITKAFTDVNTALQHVSDAVKTVATALNKVQDAVNTQGEALQKLTSQLAQNFDAISSSIDDIYNKLDVLAADAQVDRLINGRLSALSTFVSAQLVKYSEVKASRNLAMQKVNECVKSQSSRLGFCGNGTHLFSMVTGAPDGLMFLHTVLLPTEYKEVAAWAGLCVGGKAFVLRDVQLLLFIRIIQYLVTSRNMYQPRVPQMSDFVQIQSCAITYVNLTSEEFNSVVPDYIDVNKTLEDFAATLPNRTYPDFSLDQFNHTYLNISGQISVLENKSAELLLITERLQQHIQNINNSLIDLEWLDRLETYVKWPWWVWLCFAVVFVILLGLMLWCCIATGCCGCCSCITASCAGCCDCRGKRLQRYEVEKIHIQ